MSSESREGQLRGFARGENALQCLGCPLPGNGVELNGLRGANRHGEYRQEGHRSDRHDGGRDDCFQQGESALPILSSPGFDL